MTTEEEKRLEEEMGKKNRPHRKGFLNVCLSETGDRITAFEGVVWGERLLADHLFAKGIATHNTTRAKKTKSRTGMSRRCAAGAPRFHGTLVPGKLFSCPSIIKIEGRRNEPAARQWAGLQRGRKGMTRNSR